jgi:hypothetical protein
MIDMAKIKCFRFECQECGMKSSIQVFYRKDGSIGYSRARHFGADKKFYYHQQSLEYVNQKLRELGIDHGQVSGNKSIEQSGKELSSKIRMVAGGEGFELSTPNLGGWCSVQPKP